MSWLIILGVLAFVGFVGRATLGVLGSGSVDWTLLADDDDDTYAWGDDDWFDDDMYTSPIYSWMPCNIWHDPFEDDFNWSSDDDWMWDNDDD
jgi:hypothetical protein